MGVLFGDIAGLAQEPGGGGTNGIVGIEPSVWCGVAGNQIRESRERAASQALYCKNGRTNSSLVYSSVPESSTPMSSSELSPSSRTLPSSRSPTGSLTDRRSELLLESACTSEP